MRVERIEGGHREVRVVAAMACHDALLAQIAPKWSPDMVSSPWAGLVAGWTVQHYLRYGKAPRMELSGYFARWSEVSEDRATSELISKFLQYVSDIHDQEAESVEYLSDLARDHFDTVRLQRVCDTIKADLASGDVAKAKVRINTFGSIQFTSGEGVDVLTDKGAVERAFAKVSDPLIEYPGALGDFLNVALERDGLVAFMGPMKRGKTSVLMDVAFTGVLQRKRVAFFSVGDMSESQMIMRMAQRATLRPSTSRDGRWPVVLRMPTAIRTVPGSPIAEVVHVEETHDHPFTEQEAIAAFEHMQYRQVRSKSSYLKLFTYPNTSISVKGVESVLAEYERQGWVADVVVIDYADILAPINPKEDKIERVNQTWKALRALSQSRHCLVVTASQTGKESYETDLIRARHGTEFRGKFDHVTSAFGINQTEEEKEIGVFRFNVLAGRGFENNATRCVHCAGNLAVASPMMVSCF